MRGARVSWRPYSRSGKRVDAKLSIPWSSLTKLFFPSPLNSPFEYVGLTWITQGNPPISNSLIPYAKSLLPCKVIQSQALELEYRHFGGDHYSASHPGSSDLRQYKVWRETNGVRPATAFVSNWRVFPGCSTRRGSSSRSWPSAWAGEAVENSGRAPRQGAGEASASWKRVLHRETCRFLEFLAGL